MFKKLLISFGIIVLILITALLATAHYYDTDIKHELAFQVYRFQGFFKAREDIAFARSLLLIIHRNEHPPVEWSDMIGDELKRLPRQSFYFYKVWLIESETTEEDIDSSYPIFIFKEEGKRGFDLRYGRLNPVIQFTVYTKEDGTKCADAVFPLNNCLFSPDYSGDGKINHADVVIARKKIESKVHRE